MSPEVADRIPTKDPNETFENNPLSDIYSLAIIGFELMHNQPLFKDAGDQARIFLKMDYNMYQLSHPGKMPIFSRDTIHHPPSDCPAFLSRSIIAYNRVLLQRLEPKNEGICNAYFEACNAGVHPIASRKEAVGLFRELGKTQFTPDDTGPISILADSK